MPTSQVISTQIQSVRALGCPVIAIASLGIPSCSTQDEVCVIEVKVTHAMIMTVHHNTLMLCNDFNEGSELGIVFCSGDIGVMELQELPGCVGVGESGVEEVDLHLGVVVTGGCVLVAVN
jgi:hypothetical protein